MPSLLGTGTNLLFYRPTSEPGIYDVTNCLVILYLPVLPIAMYRVRPKCMNLDLSANAVVYDLDWLERYPNTWQRLAKLYKRQLVWLVVWLIPVSIAFLVNYEQPHTVEVVVGNGKLQGKQGGITSDLMLSVCGVGALWAVLMTFELYSHRNAVFRQAQLGAN